jgi:hypothetical protein
MHLGHDPTVEVHRRTPSSHRWSAHPFSPLKPTSHLPLSFYHRHVGPSRQPPSLLFLFFFPADAREPCEGRPRPRAGPVAATPCSASHQMRTACPWARTPRIPALHLEPKP